MRAIVVLLTLVVAACGADGEPVRPTMNAGVTTFPTGQKTVITVSGEARFGVSLRN